ncbi:hypothetical protein OXPF_08680 [Oxobacter pfennigii]|uniref:Uncharacterized protein n=1 Tax=Oxobacter pfennigii TaxID=36849 RepID=A0A0P8WCQ5_9CLOT|nr:ribonuclease H-like YkuK family protein [Oxobacter pfennigii]KPU45635.1 hypothetical protein OXPF_08680 [Oxobacter pfennigii]
MRSITYGDVSFEKMCHIIKDYVSKEKWHQYKIAVGTDSQNFDITKVVIVVAVWKIGGGGIFFYDIKRVKKISNMRQKIFYETSLSLEMAEKLSGSLEKEDLECDISIHVDAGDDGPTSKLIPEIVGWITSCGFKCNTKPHSYAASSIANRYSK